MAEAARSGTRTERPRGRAPLEFHPLYRQVKNTLLKRIGDGMWQAGESLPSEFEIADELGVSQGTVRKALDELTAENIVVRRQGKGTFVAAHDEARIMFQFFKLLPDRGEGQFPESRIMSVDVEPAGAEAIERLGLRRGERIIHIERIRSLAGRICIYERIVLPKTLFPGIEKLNLPNNLYELYRAKFGVTIVRAAERLKAVAAKAHEAKHLALRTGDPLLSIDRTAIAIDDRSVEWRFSLCRTDRVHYLSDLT